MGTRGNEIGDSLAWAATDHQALAHQDGGCAGPGVLEDVMWTADTGLGDLHDPGRHSGGKPREGATINLERLQISGVDADDAGAGLHSPIGLGLVMNLDQSRHPQ
jgi:hypothetical protein